MNSLRVLVEVSLLDEKGFLNVNQSDFEDFAGLQELEKESVPKRKLSSALLEIIFTPPIQPRQPMRHFSVIGSK